MSIEIKPSSERRCTNIPAIVFAILFIALTVVLVTYIGLFAGTQDLKDSCGNVCGQKNAFTNSSKCGDPDKRKFPKLLLDNSTIDDGEISDSEFTQCIKECPEGFIEISNMCSNNDKMKEIIVAFKDTWYFILIMCFVAFVFSYVVLMLFRHAAKYVIWIINIGFVIVVFALAIFYYLAEITDRAITFGIIGLIYVLLLICFREKIALVAKLFKEASKALIDIPAIMFEPILTLISLLVSFLIFATFLFIIIPADVELSLYLTAHICNFIFFTFITQFIIGCQNFIIAGTICRWYFTRDKTKLRKPIKKSFSHLFKFHLGSVCFGAILITIVKIIKTIATALKYSASESENKFLKCLGGCSEFLLDLIEKLLSFLVRNAYIIVAKEGTPFCDSGKRAYRLLLDNISEVTSLNIFGDLVLFVCRLLVVLIAGLVGYAVISQKLDYENTKLPVIIGCVLSFLIAHCFIMVFEMTVDTIFISFCIDLEQNDGQTRPYYMSDSLKKIIMEMNEHSGGNLTFGPKSGFGVEGGTDGSGMPMMPPQQSMYPSHGYGYPNSPQQYHQQPYPQQNMMPLKGYLAPFPN